MVKSKSLYHLALAGVLCAVGIIIPIFSPVKIRLDPMSFTLASHVAIFLAMFISPAVGVAVSVGTTLGFLVGGFTMPVVLRALTHVVWVALGAYYLQKHPELIDFRQQVENRNAKLFGLGAVLSIIHAALETLVCVPVYFGQGLSGAETVRILLGLVLLGSFIHSMIDYALSLLIWRPVSGTMRTSRVS